MREQVDLMHLMEFIKAHPKFTAPAPASDDLDHMLILYRQYMEKHKYDQDSIDVYLAKARYAFEICGYLSLSSPEYDLIRELIFK